MATRPRRFTTLTAVQWNALLAAADLDEHTITTVGDVEEVLLQARSVLAELPAPIGCPELAGLAVQATRNNDHDDFLLLVDVTSDVRMYSGFLDLEDFQTANATPGEPVTRHVLELLLLHRDQILAGLSAYVRTQTCKETT